MSIRDNKIKDLTPLDVTFFQGESPTAEKLEGMMVQVRIALEYIEAAMGDMFGEDENFKTWTSSIARDIGDRSFLTPVVMPNQVVTNYTQSLVAGEVEHELDMVPVGDLSTLVSSSLDSAVIPGQWKNTVAELLVPGDWTILPGYIENGKEKRSRKLVTHSPSEGGTIVFAEVTSGRGSSLERSSENVIPTVAQADDGGPYLDISVADSLTNTYLVTLPAREKMYDKTGQIIDFSASNTNIQVNKSTQMELPAWFFGADGLDLDSDDTGGVPKRFPLNLIQLWDWNTKKRVEGIVEIKASPVSGARKYQFTLQMQSDVILDVATGAYVLSVPGNSISDQLNALQHAVYNDIGRGTDMQRLIPHSALTGLRTGSVNFANRSEYYGPSSIHANDHSQYLHRNGFVDSDTGAGGNILRGDLLIGNSDLGPSDTAHEHFNVLADSFKIYFGNITEGGALFYDKVAMHDIDHSYGGLPLSWIDNAVVVEGSVSDLDPTKKHILLDGIVRTTGDVVLGLNWDDAIFVQGKMYVNDSITFIPSDISKMTGEEGETWYDPVKQELATHNGNKFIYPSERSGYAAIIGDGASTFGKFNGTDITPFTAAIAEVSGNGGGVIKVLDGSYNFLTNTVAIPANVKLEGSGPNCILSGTNSVVQLSGADAGIEHFTINGGTSATGVVVNGANCLVDHLRLVDCVKPIEFTGAAIGGKAGSSIELVNCVEAIGGSTDSNAEVGMHQSAAFFPPFANSLFDWSNKAGVAREWFVSGGATVLTLNSGATDSAVGVGLFEMTGDGTITTHKYLPISPNLGVGGHICMNCTGTANAFVGMNLYDASFNFIQTNWFVLNNSALSTSSLVTQYFHNMAVGIGAGAERFPTNARFMKPVINISGNTGTVRWDLFDIQPLNFSRAATWG